MSDLFDDPLVDALYVCAPLSWRGYEIERMYVGMGERKGWPLAQLTDVARTLRYPQEDIRLAAIWHIMQRQHKETCPPGRWAGVDRNREGDSYCFWTLFYFAYLDFLRFDFNPYFRGSWFKGLSDESRRLQIASDVVKQLIGYRGAHPLTSRVGDRQGYEKIAARAKQEDWITDWRETPESLLALAFQANGWAAFRSQPDADGSDTLGKNVQDVLTKVTMDGLSSEFRYSKDEFERRALFFMLAQRLYIRKDLPMEDSRERALFAVLYLDFYRRPLGDCFIRNSFRKKWNAIPFEKKEDFAVECRKLLVKTRNAAAKKWPEVEV